ncbi:MAG TPA: phosphatidate cytidylyltransferase [Bacteroidia bacterium]|nr:phosphatidate cytidylyltransferase [Bacteroidia bacterium]
MKDLPKRTLTAVVFAGVLLFLIYYSFYTFLLLLLIISIGGLFELFNLFSKTQFHLNTKFLVIKSVISILFLLYPVFDDKVNFSDVQLIVLSGLVIITFLEFLLRNNFAESISELFALLYLILLVMSGLDIFYFLNQREYQYLLILSVVLMIWANDTFAYFTGSLLGKRKLMPDVSPKKSVEGFIGGIIFSLITGYLCYTYFLKDLQKWTILDVMIISLIVSIAGTFGDLLESKLKRMANVKDSGNLLPGHGGILDRFDSWFMALPVISLYLHLKVVFF